MRQSFKKREFKKNSGQKVVAMAYEGRSFSGLLLLRGSKQWCFVWENFGVLNM